MHTEQGVRVSRKGFLAGAAGSAATLATTGVLNSAPALAKSKRTEHSRAHARRDPLTKDETATLVAWCDLLVPGAANAGVGEFVNAQLALPHSEAKLMLRFVTWQPPYELFYRDGLAALDAASRELFGRRFVRLKGSEQGVVRDRVLGGTVSWAGPPPGVFYLVTRGDGVDVVYGTVKGFERIGFPYRPLIEPRSDW